MSASEEALYCFLGSEIIRCSLGRRRDSSCFSRLLCELSLQLLDLVAILGEQCFIVEEFVSFCRDYDLLHSRRKFER